MEDLGPRVSVRVVQRGEDVTPADPAERVDLADRARRALASCRGRSRRRVAERDWAGVVSTASHVHVAFDRAITVDTAARPDVVLTEILVPLDGEWAGSVLVRDGDAYLSPFDGCDLVLIEALGPG